MSATRGLNVFARRSVRVLLFTLLMTAVGCCEDGNAVSECFAEITGDACYAQKPLPPPGKVCTGYKVTYIKAGSDCGACSTCGGSAYAETYGFSVGCVDNCDMICDVECVSPH